MESTSHRAPHRDLPPAETGGSSGLWALLFLAVAAVVGVVMILHSAFAPASSSSPSSPVATAAAAREIPVARPVPAALPVESTVRTRVEHSAFGSAAAAAVAAADFDSAVASFDIRHPRTGESQPNAADRFHAHEGTHSHHDALRGIEPGGGELSSSSAALAAAQIPEPSTWALIAFAAAAAGCRFVKRWRIGG